MRLPRLLPKLLAFLLLSACLDLPEVDVAPDMDSSGDAGGNPGPSDPTPDSGQHDAGTTDPRNDGGTGSDGGEQQALSVRLVLPSNASHARGDVSIQVETSEPTPDKVELFAGEVLLAELPAPYSYTWDTTSFAEGTYSLTARVVKGTLTATSPGRLLTVDRTEPQALSRTPTPEAALVPSGDTIRVEFSEALRPDTLNDDSVFLHVNGINATKSLVLSADGKVLTLSPTAPMPVPSTASVTLTSSIKDRAGNGLEAAPVSWKWQMPAWLPVGPTTGLPIPGASTPVLRLHPKTGPVLAALAASGPAEFGPAVCRWTGASWEQLGDFLGVSHYDPESQEYFQFYGPAFEVDDKGTLVVSWTEDGSNGSSTTYLRRWATDQWAEIPSTWDFYPTLQLRSADNPWIATKVWDAQSAGQRVQVRWWNGQAWQDFGEALRANTTSNIIYNISFVIDDAGLPIVAWNEAEQVNGNYTNRRIHVRRWTTPAGWAALGGPLSVNSSGSEASVPVLRLSKTGVPVLAWSEPNTALTKTKASDIHVRSWEDGQWRQLGDYLSASSGETSAWAPSLVLADNGAPTIAWVESDGIDNKVHVRRWLGTEWQTIEGTASAIAASAKAGELSLQLDAAGNPWVAWVTDKHVAHVYRFNR